MTNAQHLELLVEERSMKAFLDVLLPRLLPDRTFFVHAFEGKQDLLKLLPRLRHYETMLRLRPDWRLFVMVDQNGSDCRKLKAQLEESARKSRLITRTRGGKSWQVVNRIVIQELEAWYFGDWEAVCTAYPRVRPGAIGGARYRDPDGIRGTWEAFEQILSQRGYFETGLSKIEAARAVAAHFDPARNRSRSFKVFLEAVYEAVEQPLPDQAAIPCRR